MQAYDLIMLIVLAMATIFGAIKGFAWQVASIASVIVSYVVAYRFRFELAEKIQVAEPPWNLFLSMLILYVGTSFLIWIAFRLLSSTIDRVKLKEFDRHLGAGFGLLKGLVYCLLITMFAMSLLGKNQQRAICQSRSGYYIATALDKGVGILPKEIHDVVGPYLANLDNKLNQHGQPGEQTETVPWDPNRIGGGILENGLSEDIQETLNNLPNNFTDGFGQSELNLPSGDFTSPNMQPSTQQPGLYPPSYPNGGLNGFGADAGTGLRSTSQSAQLPTNPPR